MDNLYKIKLLSWDQLTVHNTIDVKEYRAYVPATGMSLFIADNGISEFNLTVFQDDLQVGEGSTFLTLFDAMDAGLQLHLKIMKTMLEEVLDDN